MTLIDILLVVSVSAAPCTRMKMSDTLIFHGQPQRAEQFVECVVGRWPNVHSVFRAKGNAK